MKITRMSGINLGFTHGTTATLQLEITRDDKKKGARIITQSTPRILLPDFKYLAIYGLNKDGVKTAIMGMSELGKKAA